MRGWSLDHKPHLVKWTIVCLDKRFGGWVVKDLSSLNKALHCKWSWCYASESGALWHDVIKGKYGEEEGGWSTCVVREGYGVVMETDKEVVPAGEKQTVFHCGKWAKS